MKLVPMHFDYDTNAVSLAAFEQHIKLYNGYIEKFNETSSRLAADDLRAKANPTYSEYRGLKQGQGFSAAGVLLHEIYFGGMSARPSRPCTVTMSLLDSAFGNYKAWMEDFKACAAAARGWCVLAYEPRSEGLTHLLLDSHNDGMVAGTYPLIALDMYEHSYFRDYGIDRASYVNNFINSIHWIAVSRRIRSYGLGK